MSLIFWAAAGVAAMFLDRGGAAPAAHQRSLIVLAVVSMAFGAWAFWTNGGARISAAGLYCFAMGVFVGFAAAWHWQLGRATDEVYLATVAGWWTTFTMYAFFWRNAPPSRGIAVPSSEVTTWGIHVGIATTMGAFVLGVLDVGNVVQFALGGMALLMVSLILHATRGERVVGPLVLTALIVLAFWQFVFSGGGRLNLVALSLVGFILMSMRMTGRKLKTMTLLGAPFAVVGLARLDELYTDGSSTDRLEKGLASVVNPLLYFGELVTSFNRGGFTLGQGDTFTATALFWVPRPLWPDKADGFGSVLTGILKPEFRGSGYSLAALSYGEWFYNFGWLGVVAMLLVVGWLIRKLDRLLVQWERVDSRRALLAMCALLILAAAIPTFAWVGSFTYVARVGQQLIPIALLAVPFATRGSRAGARVGQVVAADRR